MVERFNRIQALLGYSAIQKLAESTVMVVGCGAVGSFAAEALARSGIGQIILIDSDVIEESNINRQIFALTSTIGMPKVNVASVRIRDINPDATVIPLQMFWDEKSDVAIRPNFVIDAIDTVESKIALYKWCESHHIPFVASMGAALKTDPAQIKVGRILKTSVCPLAARVRRIVREEKLSDFPVVYSTEMPDRAAATPGRVFGSMVTITGIFGLRLADIAIKRITGID